MKLMLALGLAASALGGCSQMANNTICASPPSMESDFAASQADDAGGVPAQRMLALNCVHRWSYRLAPSSDAVDDVAEAVLGACSDAIFRAAYAQEKEAESRQQVAVGFNAETGMSENYYSLGTEEHRRQAVFRVVQARAGNCAVPA